MTVSESPRLVGVYLAILLVVQAGWVFRGKHVPEGVVLVTFDRTHGLTLSDLGALALAGVALALFSTVVFDSRGDAV